MTLHIWWLFLVAVFLTCATPGPNMLHIMSRSVAVGVKRSLAAMAGCLTAMLVVLLASAAGVTALLLAMPGLFDALRYAGVAYLLYLGWRAWIAPVSAGDAVPVTDAGRNPALTPLHLFRAGFAVGISNPKLLLFAAAFFPQFIQPAAAKPPQFAILIVTFLVVEAFWYAVYGFGGQGLARWLARPAAQRGFNRFTAVLFWLFGAALLRVRPA